jgi:hypothetical protein
MASRDSSPGQGFYLNLLGKSSLPAVLAGFAQQTADLRNEVYVIGPAEVPGWFFVANACNPQPYRVQSLNGVNYAPGTKVILGNQGSGKGGPEFIIGSVGQAGGSEVSVSTSVTFGTFPVIQPPPPTPPCAIQIPNHRYLGIIRDSSNVLRVFLYLDGTIGSQLGSSWDPASDSVGASFPAVRIHPRDVVVFPVQTLGVPPYHFQLATWDPAAGAPAILDTTAVYGGLGGNFTPGWAWRPGTGELYFLTYTHDIPSGDYYHQVYKVTVGASGTLSLGGAAVGTPFLLPFVSSFAVICGGVLAVNGGRFDLSSHLWSAAPADAIGGFNSDGALPCANCQILSYPSSADGSTLVAYPIGKYPVTDSNSYFLRLVPPVRFGPSLDPPCSFAGTLVQPDGSGDVPVAFLARD